MVERLKESLLNLVLNKQSEILYSLLLLYEQVDDYQNILKGADQLRLPHVKLFKKQKEAWK